VIFGPPPMWCAADSCQVIKRMLAADRSGVAGFRVERVPPGDGRFPAVFRVIEENGTAYPLS